MKRHAAPLNPRYPERICWGCDKFCPADDLACANGTIRTPHPQELFGDDWLTWCERSTASVDNGPSNDGDRSSPLNGFLAPDLGVEDNDVPEQGGVEPEKHG